MNDDKKIRDMINHLNKNKNQQSNNADNSSQNSTNQDPKTDVNSKLNEKRKSHNPFKNFGKPNKESQLNNVVNTMNSIGKGLVNSFNFLVTLITNPITWLVILVGIIVLVTQAGVNTIGQSDYGNNCIRQSQGDGDSSSGSSSGESGSNAKVHVSIPASANSMQGLNLARLLANKVAAAVGIKEPRWIFAQILLESGYSNPTTWHRAVAAKNLTGINGGPDTKFSTWSAYASVWASTLKKDGAAKWNSLSDMNAMLSRQHYYWYGSSDSHFSSQAAEQAAYLKMLTAQEVKYNGKSDTTSGNGSSGSTSHCDSTGLPASTNNILKFALSIAYPNSEYKKSLVKGGDGKGRSVAPEAYIKAMAAAGNDPQRYYASCDGFVATVIRNTVDGNYPWHATGNQLAYLKSHPKKWKKVSCKDVQGGDVIMAVTKSGAGDNHTMIWDNNNYVVSGSLGQRVGVVDKSRYNSSGQLVHGCSGSLIRGADGHDYGQAFRFIGTPHPYKK